MEPNETFLVNLTGPVGATLADGQGQGTITNDDSTPRRPATEPSSWVNASAFGLSAGA